MRLREDLMGFRNLTGLEHCKKKPLIARGDIVICLSSFRPMSDGISTCFFKWLPRFHRAVPSTSLDELFILLFYDRSLVCWLEIVKPA